MVCIGASVAFATFTRSGLCSKTYYSQDGSIENRSLIRSDCTIKNQSTMGNKLHTEKHYQNLVLRLLLSSTDSSMTISSEAFRSANDPELKRLLQNVGDSIAGVRAMLQGAINLLDKSDRL